MNAPLFGWGSPIERERRTRIRLSLMALAYEIGEPMASDAEFDRLALTSRPEINTGHLDEWWRQNFVPYSGQWVLTHPEMATLQDLYIRVTKHA